MGQSHHEHDDSLASIPDSLSGDKYDLLNGYLMSAAPILLAALIETQNYLKKQPHPPHRLIERVQAAIDATEPPPPRIKPASWF